MSSTLTSAYLDPLNDHDACLRRMTFCLLICSATSFCPWIGSWTWMNVSWIFLSCVTIDLFGYGPSWLGGRLSGFQFVLVGHHLHLNLT